MPKTIDTEPVPRCPDCGGYAYFCPECASLYCHTKPCFRRCNCGTFPADLPTFEEEISDLDRAWGLMRDPKTSIVSWDIETTGLKWHSGDRIIGYALYFPEHDEDFYFPNSRHKPLNFFGKEEIRYYDDASHLISHLLYDTELSVYGWNIKFDYNFFRATEREGKLTARLLDVMLGLHLANENLRSYELKECGVKFCGYPADAEKKGLGTLWDGYREAMIARCDERIKPLEKTDPYRERLMRAKKTFRSKAFYEFMGHLKRLPVDAVATYGRRDARIPWQIWKDVVHPILSKELTRQLFYQVSEYALSAADMEYYGIQVDPQFCQEKIAEQDRRIAELISEIREATGKTINPRSVADIQTILYPEFAERLRLQEEEREIKLADAKARLRAYGYRTDKAYLKVRETLTPEMQTEINGVLTDIKAYSKKQKQLPACSFPTGKGTLSDSDDPVVDLIEEARQRSVSKGTYFSNYLKRRDREDRIHPSARVHGTVSSRWAYRDPNFQNLPRKTDVHDVRGAVVAKKGYTLLSFDFSQIELRMLAHYCQDPLMLRIYRDNEFGGDIHTLTSEMLGLPALIGAREGRQAAKTINFALIYGMQAPGLKAALKAQAGLRVSLDRAQNFLIKYKKTYAAVDPWCEECQRFARLNRYIPMWTGRRRHYGNVWEAKDAVNNIIQGGAAEVMRISITRLRRIYRDSEIEPPRMILQVHDDLIQEVRDDLLPHWIPIVQQNMEDFQFNVPIKVEGKAGKRWSQMTKL